MNNNQARGGPAHTTDEASCYWVMAPAAVGKAIGALESLASIRQYDADGIMQGRSALRAGSIIPLAIRKKLDTVGAAATLQFLTLVGAVMVLAGKNTRNQQIVGSALMLSAEKLSEIRNAFGGDGADQMSELISAYRLLTAAIPNKAASDDLFLRGVNAQVAISYIASGLAKLVSSTWRSGDALQHILSTEQYGASSMARFFRTHHRLAKLVSWATIIGETAYPLVYLTSPTTTRVVLLGAKLFHLGIAVTMGLPRFCWAFSSSHAAVSYVVRQRSLTS